MAWGDLTRFGAWHRVARVNLSGNAINIHAPVLGRSLHDAMTELTST